MRLRFYNSRLLFHSLQHRNLIGVFDIATNWDTHGDARYLHARALELLRKVSCRSFAFDGRVGRDNDFIDIAGIHPRDQV